MFMSDIELTDLLRCTHCNKLYGLYCDYNNFTLNINMYGYSMKKCKYKKILKNKLSFTIKKNNSIIEK